MNRSAGVITGFGHARVKSKQGRWRSDQLAVQGVGRSVVRRRIKGNWYNALRWRVALQILRAMNLAGDRHLLDGKRIVIIGGTTGLGLSAAKAFLANGARVIVVGRNAESVAAARTELGNQARALQGDATQPQTAATAIAEAVN